MFKRNKKQEAPVVTEASEKQENANDFSFIPEGSRVYEKKMESKPTTFFADAMKRFAKSKASVAASAILLILIGLAIIVPFANHNNIDTPRDSMRYLPPKWFDGKNGFLDGTKYITNVVLDPDTADSDNPQLGANSGYDQRGVVGKIKATKTTVDAMSDAVANYGQGGAIRLSARTKDKDTGAYQDAYFLSPELTLVPGDAVSFTVSVNDEWMDELNGEGNRASLFFGIQADFDGDGVKEYHALPEVAEANGAYALNDVLTTLSGEENYPTSSFTGSFFLGIKGGAANETPREVALTSIKAEANGTSDVSAATFLDATKQMGKIRFRQEGAYSLSPTLSSEIYHATMTYGSFRYDYYEAALGTKENYVFSKSEIDAFVSRGWIEFDWDAIPSTPTSGIAVEDASKFFRLTKAGEKYSPIRKVTRVSNYYSSMLNITRRDVTGDISQYRYEYYLGNLGSCEMPKFVFGTDQWGHDFFKLVFSGLLASLALGVLSSVINIAIGLIWGSISGYFGGWVDIIMERVTEILGGVPFIVVMTLIIEIVSKGQPTFWTYLFALCFTGWMGVASTTREQFYRYKGREYVLASRTLGASDPRLIFRHILPNGIGTIVTGSVLMIPSVIFTEANVSYLLPNLKVTDHTSFGLTLQQVQGSIQSYPYLIVSASLVMALIMISFNLFGNGLRDAFNPSLKGDND